MESRRLAIEAHKVLLNGSGKLDYFERRGISEQFIQAAYVGFLNGAFTYPCMGRNGGLLAIHCKSEHRDRNGKRRQWWTGYADDLPPRGHGRDPSKPAKVIPFGPEMLKDVGAGSQVILCGGEEDAPSLRQAGYTALSQPGAGLLEPAYAHELPDVDHRQALKVDGGYLLWTRVGLKEVHIRDHDSSPPCAAASCRVPRSGVPAGG